MDSTNWFDNFDSCKLLRLETIHEEMMIEEGIRKIKDLGYALPLQKNERIYQNFNMN